jgi:predicted short-subunit dehydrogenase-like oxidoreductase (DUF2520 family)
MMKRITLIGSGRIATAMGKGFYQKDCQIVQVFSRSINQAKELAIHLEAEPIDSLKHLSDQTDLVLLAVSDQAITEVADQLPWNSKPVIHCSGSQPSSLLCNFPLHGVMYPPQTFSIGHEVDLWNTPFFLEASSQKLFIELSALVSRISSKVYEANSETRLSIHLAAVFANNFTNHLYQIAAELLQKHQLPLDILFPIMQETIDKLRLMSPSEAQTGPATRNDMHVLESHLNILKDLPDYSKIYSFVSESIINRKKLS